MKRNITALALMIAILAASCASQKKKDQTISLSGAFALYPLVVKWTEEYQKLNPDIRFNVSGGGAGKGMADALAGTVDLGMFSREITAEEKVKGYGGSDSPLMQLFLPSMLRIPSFPKSGRKA